MQQYENFWLTTTTTTETATSILATLAKLSGFSVFIFSSASGAHCSLLTKLFEGTQQDIYVLSTALTLEMLPWAC